MPARDMPVAEIDIDDGLVRALLREQFPDLAELDLCAVGEGWDNSVFRLGNDLAVRLPRRAVAAVLTEHEQRWLPELAAHLPLPIPAPLRMGRPSAAYPWRWSVCRWFPGTTAAEAALLDPGSAAEVLARFVRALHHDAPSDAPENPYRGIPLVERKAALDDGIRELGGAIDGAEIRRRWESATKAPPSTRPPVWIHGDLHPANLIVEDGRLAGVIDFGDLTAGDPATDLSVAWMLFDARTRERFFRVAGTDADTKVRARGWALSLGVAFLANSANNQRIAAIGRRALDAALAEPR